MGYRLGYRVTAWVTAEKICPNLCTINIPNKGRYSCTETNALIALGSAKIIQEVLDGA